ncbi:unnamed protein product [Rotaria sordida]|uniref:Uncharacterized protein n=1 Tax=Rotaria sordida TaxID=392033 RepID=A0A814NZE2_9BILA|nr:unnamed protein product [Rotaria sordida]CAF1459635.1 unnamed protein product [Rotaria sordida]
MTSLVLFNSEPSLTDDFIKPGVDWGTGKKRIPLSKDPSSAHPSGTFLYKGEPIAQNYRNTDITLSNVRINDELIPASLHTTDITPHQIPLKFPSNHPFSSHISEKALFPNASINIDDRPSIDKDPYIVTHKIRGNPFRREVHYQGLQRERHRNLKWPDKQYMHLPRSFSDLSLSSIYPWPRKIFVPNDDSSIENSGTNIVKNKDRVLFETTYQSDFSNGEGLGTHAVYDTTVSLQPTEQLTPYFKKTLDPARPIEGMQAIHIHGNHRQPSALDKRKTSTETIKVMSENEKLDDHMRNGTDYVNLPAHMFPTERAATWIPRSETSNTNNQQQQPEIRFLHHLRPSASVPQIARDHQASHQQIEAENRLEQLELIRPQDNLNLLNIKFRTLQHPRHSRPILPQYRDAYVNTFYDQLGTYIQERSGLYHTNTYDPNALIQAIPDIENSENNQNENDNLLKDENYLGDLLDSSEQTQNVSKPKLFQYKTFHDYQAMRSGLLNKFRVPQDTSTVNTRIQEGNKPFIQRESTYGQSYNTRKFLQENTLLHHSRSDPTCLMSTQYNTNLERARSMNSYPMKPIHNISFNNNDNNNKEKTNDILIGPLIHPSPYDELFATKYITEHTDGYSRRSVNRVYDSPFKSKEDMTAYKFFEKKQTPVTPYLQISDQLPRSAKNVLRLPGPEVVSRFLEPKLEPHSTYQHSYKDVSFHETILPIQDARLSFDSNYLSMKDNDERFGRTSDGRIKQWKLIGLQDRWTKTKAQKQYHIDHPESVPYVGERTIQTKKEILIADNIERQRMMTVR